MKIGITNQNEDDFIRDVVAIRAEDGAVSRTWTIPGRLMRRADVCGIVVEELMAEVSEAIERERDGHLRQVLKEAVSGR